MTTHNSPSYTESELRRAVASSMSFRDVLHNLGLVGAGGNYEVLRRRINAARIDTSHFRIRRRVSHLEDQQLVAAIAQSRSYAQALRILGIAPTGVGYRLVRGRAAQLGLSVEHFSRQGQRSARSMRGSPARALAEILVEGVVPMRSSKLRERLVREGIMIRCCSACRLHEWHGEPIPLELDHINGRRDDNRLTNLRPLCPNCHAQTPTYRGRNIGVVDARRGEPTSSETPTEASPERVLLQQPTQLSLIA